jgi:hypothetical protein
MSCRVLGRAEKDYRRWRRIQDKGDTIPNSGEFGHVPEFDTRLQIQNLKK